MDVTTVDELIRLIENGHFILARVALKGMFKLGLISEHNSQTLDLAIWEKELERAVLIKSNAVETRDQSVQKLHDLFKRR